MGHPARRAARYSQALALSSSVVFLSVFVGSHGEGRKASGRIGEAGRRVLCSGHRDKFLRRAAEVEEVVQRIIIGGRAFVLHEEVRVVIRRINFTQGLAVVSEDKLGEVEHAAEVVVQAGGITGLGIRRHDQQRHAETVDILLAVAATILVAEADSRGGIHVVVETSPIVPGDEDGGGVIAVVSPVVALVIAVGPAVSDSVDDGGNPRRSGIGARRARMVGPVSVRNYPAHLAQPTIGNVIQYLSRTQSHVAVGPIGSSTNATTGLANVIDSIGSIPQAAGANVAVIAPADRLGFALLQQIGKRGMLIARISGSLSCGRVSGGLHAIGREFVNQGAGVGEATVGDRGTAA